MVIQLRTSFPRRETPSATAQGARVVGEMSPFAIIAIVVFVTTAALAVGVFFYHGFLIRDILAKDEQLVGARKSFEPEFVETATRLDARIKAASQTLSLHTAFSLLFALLEKRTLETVRFKGFSLESKGEREFSISLSGEAKSFNAVALQSDVFGGEKKFLNPVFSNFTLSDRGNVFFQFTTTLDPVLVAYRELLPDYAPAKTDEDTPENVSDESSPFESGTTE